MKHRPSRVFTRAATAIAALLAAPVTGVAQPFQTPRAAFDAGIAAIEDSRYMDAIVALEESYRLRPLPVVLFNLGLAYRAVGRERQAIDAFERYLAAPERNADPGRIAAVEQELAELRNRGCVVSLRAQPPQALLQIDGRPQSAMRGEVRIDPGPHVFEVSAEGYRSHQEEHTLGPGGRLELDVTLTPIPALRRAPQEPAPSTEPRAEGPFETPQEPRPPSTEEPSHGRGLTALFWVGLGVGAAAAATAAGLWADGNAQQRSYDLACRTWPPARDCASRFQLVQADLDSRANLVNGVWAVAGVGAAAALLDVVLMSLATPTPTERRESTSLRDVVRIQVAPGRAGVEVRW